MGLAVRGINYTPLATESTLFDTAASLSVQGTTLPVSGRSWSDVSGFFSGSQITYSGYVVPRGINAAEIRFQTTADGDAHVVQVWGARGRDHVTLLAILALTGGTQEADSGRFFVDTITASSEGLTKAGQVVDSGNNRICRYVVDLCGYDRILFLATTLQASTTLIVQVAGY